MGTTRRIYQVDAFTKERFAGNPAGVVANADGLSEAQMLAIARELNNSETAFILSRSASDHDLQIRFFTPTMEVPACGHATIAAIYIWAMENRAEPRRMMVRIGIGVIAVEIQKLNGDFKIVMTQGEPVFREPLATPVRAELLSALKLRPEDLAPRCPIQVVSTGLPMAMIGLASRAVLDSLQPDFAELKRLSGLLDTGGFHCFTLDSPRGEILAFARMFAPALGIAEDPVTGMASGALGAYLLKHGLMAAREGRASFRACQGEAIGRPGTVEVTVTEREGAPVLVQIAGEAVVAFATTIDL